MLAENWQIIRDEGLAQLDASGAFRPEEENLRESGINAENVASDIYRSD